MLRAWLLIMSFATSTWAAQAVAHRGASGHAPENTLPAIELAIEMGSQFVEIDVQLSKDGKVVVIHDETVDRTTDGEGRVKDLAFSELRSLDAGSWFSEEFKGAKIPSLKEVLELDFKESKLIIEVKNSGDKYPGLEKKIVDLVLDSDTSKNVIYKSFGVETLALFRKLHPEVEQVYVTIGPVIDGLLVIDDWARFGSLFDVDAEYYQVHRFLASKSLVQKVHKASKKLIIWDVQKDKHFQKMKGLGVDIIETDWPEKVVSPGQISL